MRHLRLQSPLLPLSIERVVPTPKITHFFKLLRVLPVGTKPKFNQFRHLKHLILSFKSSPANYIILYQQLSTQTANREKTYIS